MDVNVMAGCGRFTMHSRSSMASRPGAFNEPKHAHHESIRCHRTIGRTRHKVGDFQEPRQASIGSQQCRHRQTRRRWIQGGRSTDPPLLLNAASHPNDPARSEQPSQRPPWAMWHCVQAPRLHDQGICRCAWVQNRPRWSVSNIGKSCKEDEKRRLKAKEDGQSDGMVVNGNGKNPVTPAHARDSASHCDGNGPGKGKGSAAEKRKCGTRLSHGRVPRPRSHVPCEQPLSSWPTPRLRCSLLGRCSACRLCGGGPRPCPGWRPACLWPLALRCHGCRDVLPPSGGSAAATSAAVSREGYSAAPRRSSCAGPKAHGSCTPRPRRPLSSGTHVRTYSPLAS
mmetsp:Transcript_43665/g.139113  ORF Transcript_43665/g.139113 Transcript_43665/m.139113 type:complete len:339 (-) Transcript_43665:1685-2701(-)